MKSALIAREAGVDPKSMRYVAFEGGGEAMTALMGGLLVSLIVRRRRVWVKLVQNGTAGPGTVSVELGGLARTDNSGWGDEFEKLGERLLAGMTAHDVTGKK